MRIRPFSKNDRTDDTESVVALWRECGLTRPWNDPYADIVRKLSSQPELFLVGETEAGVQASVMVGFDGHRGWMYYLAVASDRRGTGLGRALVAEAERLLTERGCPKIMLMVRSTNEHVVAFYRTLGYATDEVVVLGKRLIED
ncbi:ribosomal protein S18 acetylase RimI-like enzyme [Mycetocola sp. CAN_C7]|uniref:GNAT family acetyltransferase n=1 Tax=Mycetocola sp. CAN_C7 TaxID=2787724 RepID=UPI0018C97D92